MVQVKYLIAGLLHTVYYLCLLLFILSLAQKTVVNKVLTDPLAARWLQVCSESVDEYFLLISSVMKLWSVIAEYHVQARQFSVVGSCL